MQRRRPKRSSCRTETGSRAKEQKLLWLWESVVFTAVKAWSIDPFRFWASKTGGDRKVTTGITGLWPPRDHIDVAFWFFDVGSSYHSEAAFRKCRIVHPCKGTWAGFRPSRDRLVLSYWSVVRYQESRPVREEHLYRSTSLQPRSNGRGLKPPCGMLQLTASKLESHLHAGLAPGR